MINCGKRNILGILVDAVDYESSVSAILIAARAHIPYSVSALAVHGVMTGIQDAFQRYRLNHLDLLVPDGQPVRWGLNWLHHVGLVERVYGPNLMLAVCSRAAEEHLPVYFYGSRPQVLAALCANLQQRFPQLIIAGQSPSLFRKSTQEEKKAIIQRILKSGSAITFVGLGCPRQEIWIYEYCAHLSQPTIAVGAAFDFHAGMLPQAPEWMQKSGLEWFFRLTREPGRLWKRYLLLNPWYLALLVQQKLNLRKFDPDDAIPPRNEVLYA